MSTSAFDLAYYKAIGVFFQALVKCELLTINQYEFLPTTGGPLGRLRFTIWTAVPHRLRLYFDIDLDFVPDVDTMVETIKEEYLDMIEWMKEHQAIREYRIEEIYARD